MEAPFGYYFCRKKGQDKIETCLCYGGAPKDTELIEHIPQKVIKYCQNGVKILNLQKILKIHQK